MRLVTPGREVELTIDRNLEVQADPRLLAVVFDNLLGNAWKFTRPRKPAHVHGGRTAGDGPAAYYVRDDGVGFDMAYADQLFGAFQRLHPTGQFEGNGVGLATVRRVITRHGGRVWAEGAVGGGATFWFTLPNE